MLLQKMNTTILYSILVLAFTLNFVNTKSPQYIKQQHNDLITERSSQQPPAATNNNLKTSSTSFSKEKESQILHKDMEMHADGSYHYNFETSNGIKRTEKGAIDGTIQGSSSYISPEGIEIKTTYIADENGYHPVGDHIPRIPDYIIHALEYIRNHPYIEKDYYTGKVKQTSFNNKNSLATSTKSSSSNKNKGSHTAKNNFRHNI